MELRIVSKKGKKMNIYLVSRTDSIGYDEYDSFIIACKDEETARNTYPSNFMNNEFAVWNGENYVDSSGYPESGCWVDNPKKLEVKLLGKAAKGVNGILCASFNAG